MKIIECSTGNKVPVKIDPVIQEDYRKITKKRYFFDWATEKKHEVFKLTLEKSEEILGLVSIETISDEWRLHIRLLTVSEENRGVGKGYEGIAGNLIAYVSNQAILKFAELACVSLKPKTQLVEHYMSKYNMKQTGRLLSLQIPEIFEIIEEYDDE